MKWINKLMNKKEFIGNLDNISPLKIINKDKEDSYESFFLILGMIFNDLKGLIFIQKTIEDDYRKPSIDEISSHMGEYSGLITHSRKLIIATVAEFFIFIDKNKSVLSNPKFSLLLKRLDPQIKNNWTKLVDPDKDITSILSNIARVRNNVSFHYDHSGYELRRGFIRSFFKEGKDLLQHQKAYFSLGNTMESTRFYFSDASLEEYIKSLLNNADSATFDRVIREMNLTLQAILGAYIKSIKR